MFDWQTITVALIILAAVIYAGWLVWARLRSLRLGKDGTATCETGCGSCGGAPKAPVTERTVFVEISRSKPSQRQTARSQS